MEKDIKQARKNTANIIRILLESDILTDEQKKEFVEVNEMNERIHIWVTKKELMYRLSKMKDKDVEEESLIYGERFSSENDIREV